MNNFVLVDPPMDAYILPEKQSRFGDALAKMGLGQEFRVVAVATDGSKVVVHPDDIRKPSSDPTTIRRDFVEFVDPGEASARGINIPTHFGQR